MVKRIKRDTRFRTFWYHRKPGYWLYRHRPRPAGTRSKPEIIRFGVEPGTPPSTKPPVRIFLGTEAAQHRATRVFVWSIKKVRDPSRVYEIYLMNDLQGFDRTKWKTGFTNYRYAIPALAGGTGRAIYNDVDQIYLSDPAELFDLDMEGAGVLSVYDWENAVMLIDCEKMIRHWKIEDVHSDKKHKYFLDIVNKEQLWKPLLGVWNTRDCEYPVAQTKCLHYTTLHTQPWHPFPQQLRYFPHAEGEVWYALEREADAANFSVE